MSSSRVDADGDGVVDLLWYYDNGVTKESYILEPRSNLKVVKNEYKLGKLIRSFRDLDRSGSYDQVCEFDFYENETCKEQYDHTSE